MSNNKKKIIAVVLLFIAAIIATYFGSTYYFEKKNGISKMLLIKNDLYKYYDGTIDENTLNENAIKGMVNSLNDPYTVFMDSKEFEQFNAVTQGNYVGVGVEVDVQNNQITIVAVLDNSPAKQSGMAAGDIIKSVNGTSVGGNDLDKAVSMIKGPEGTAVKIGLYRKDKGDFELTLQRKKVQTNTVTGEMVDNTVGYIDVSMFDENTDKNFARELDDLNGKKMKGLILDLRGNPGGLVDICQNMLSNFIAKDEVLVYMIDKYNHKQVYNSNGGEYLDLPVVILVDGNSASASEIFSGAMSEYKRALLIGTKTFGKGVVQQILDTGDGTALKVTTAKYYTPNGININHQGIKPDIEVAYPDNLKDKPYDRNLDPQFNKALETIKEKIK